MARVGRQFFLLPRHDLRERKAFAIAGMQLITQTHLCVSCILVSDCMLDFVDMSPADGAAAFASGNLDMVCGWGGALRRMKEHGNVLLSGSEKEALGIQVFDATTVSTHCRGFAVRLEP